MMDSSVLNMLVMELIDNAVFLINILTPISFSFLDLFLSWFKTAVSAAQSPAASAAIVQKTCHYLHLVANHSTSARSG